MLHSTTTLLGQEISSLLRTRELGHPLYCMQTVSSTNTLALEAAQRGATHGTVFFADYQTDGRGRQGRIWKADACMNLTFSIVLDFPGKKIGMLPLAACLGVSDAIADATVPVQPQLKWPNDILIQSRKVCGILLQTAGPPAAPVILGIGINVNQTIFSGELSSHATSLLLATGRFTDRAALMASVLLNLERTLGLMVAEPSTIHQIYSERMIWKGQSCRISGINDDEITGTLLGIEESGGLLLETDTGIRTIYAGNVSLRTVGC